MMTNLYPFLMAGPALKHERIPHFPDVSGLADTNPENYVLVAHCGYFGLLPPSFATEWTARPKVLAIVDENAHAVDARLPEGPVTLAKLARGAAPQANALAARLRTTVGIEALVGAALLLAVGVMTSVAPSRTAVAQPGYRPMIVTAGADGVQETFKADLAKYLRGTEFPSCPVDAAKYNEVRMMADGDPEGPGMGGTVGTHSWVYNYETGDFFINSQEVSADGVTTYDQF